MPRVLIAALIAMSCLIVGCGGGDSADGPTPNAPPTVPFTQAERDAAVAAALSATVDTAANTLKLEWKDNFAAGTNFVVEATDSMGAFSRIEDVPGSGGTRAQVVWKQAAGNDRTYRVLAITPAGNLPLSTVDGRSTVTAGLPSELVGIIIDKPEPVVGTAILSLNSAAPYKSVTWYSDLKLIGTGATEPGNPIGWSTSSETEGAHLVLASVQVSTGVFVEYRRTVNVTNPEIAASIAKFRGSTADQTFLDVTATAASGVAKVSATLDGVPNGELTGRNGCVPEPCIGRPFEVFRFAVNNRAVGSGAHDFRVLVTDGSGETLEVTYSLLVSNAPVITLQNPVDGSFVSGIVNISGTAVTDKLATVTTRVTLGNLNLLTTTSPNFSVNFDTAGLAAGRYTLSVSAVDSTGIPAGTSIDLYISSSGIPPYQELIELGSDGKLLAARGDDMLYRAQDTTVHWLNTKTGQDITLAQAAATNDTRTQWTLGSHFVIAEGYGANCTGRPCIYLWASDGTVKNLSVTDPFVTAQQLQAQFYSANAPIVDGHFVAWESEAQQQLSAYDVSTGAFYRIVPPAGSTTVAIGDTFTRNGVLQVFYLRWSTLNAPPEIFRWDSQSGTSVPLGIQAAALATDGSQIFWREFVPPPAVPTFPATSWTLKSRALSGGLESTVSEAATGFRASDGLFQWSDANGAYASINGGPTIALSIDGIAATPGATGVRFILNRNQALYKIEASTGIASKITDTVPSTYIDAGTDFYFLLGANQNVYKIEFE